MESLRRLSKKLVFLAPALLPSLLMGGLTWTTTEQEIAAGVGEAEVKATFVFRNTGDEPVTISRVKTSCGCTTAGLEKKTYAPGESGQIALSLKTVGRGPEQTVISQVFTDQQKTPHYLKFTAQIPVPVTADRRVIIWRLDQKPEPQELVLTLLEGYTLDVEALPAALPVGFSLEATERSEDGWKLRLKPTDTREKRRGVFVVPVTKEESGQRASQKVFLFVA